MTVSVGGEIGEVGGKNSDVHELHAYMEGFNRKLKKRGADLVGLSKISVQTGTAHGGFVNADGTVRTDVKIDLKTLEELSRVARDEYGLAGAVQHGASTLPPDAFDAFPRVGACEIHLATDFQNMVYEHPQFPADLKAEMYAWIRENATEERKPKDTEEQFIYKARKKAIGPFKQRMWSIADAPRTRIGQSLEERFTFLMQQLKIDGTAAAVARFVQRAAGADRSRSRDRRRRRQDHRGREEGRRARRLVGDAAVGHVVRRRHRPPDHAERHARHVEVRVDIDRHPRAVDHDGQLVDRDRARRIPLTARLESCHLEVPDRPQQELFGQSGLETDIMVRRRVVRKFRRRVVHHLLSARLGRRAIQHVIRVRGCRAAADPAGVGAAVAAARARFLRRISLPDTRPAHVVPW